MVFHLLTAGDPVTSQPCLTLSLILAYSPSNLALDYTPDEHISIEKHCAAVEMLQSALEQLSRGFSLAASV